MCIRDRVYSFDTVCEIVDYNLICSDENAPWGAIMNMEIVDSILTVSYTHLSLIYKLSPILTFDVYKKTLECNEEIISLNLQSYKMCIRDRGLIF